MAMMNRPLGIRCFITVEPIMEMVSPHLFANAIANAKPEFINIGADSKKSNLREPTKEQVEEFVARLQQLRVVIREKINLSRILEV